MLIEECSGCRACRLHLGAAGAAVAMTCCTGTNALLLTLYQTYRDKVLLAGKPQSTWRGYSMAAFRGWWQYLSLGVPAAAMICLVRRGACHAHVVHVTPTCVGRVSCVNVPAL